MNSLLAWLCVALLVGGCAFATSHPRVVGQLNDSTAFPYWKHDGYR